MISVTESAKEMILQSIKDKGEKPSVRIYLAGVG
jgi:hypothetical protein